MDGGAWWATVYMGSQSRHYLATPSHYLESALCVLSRLVVSDPASPWTVDHQAPLSMGFSRQKYKRGYAFLFPRNLPNPEIESRSPVLQADSLSSEQPF